MIKIKNEKRVCAICGNVFVGYGNNPQPVLKKIEYRVCDECNYNVVLRARLNTKSTTKN